MIRKYVRADIVHGELQKLCCKYNISFGGGSAGFGSELAEFSENLPAADVCDIRRGEWIEIGADYDWGFSCSECHWKDRRPFSQRYKFCPNCGAEMSDGAVK